MPRTWLYALGGLIGFLGFVYLFLQFGLPLVLPFVIAIILSELMDPIVRLFTFRGKLSRSIAVGLVLLVLVGLMLMAITAAVGRLIQEIQGVIATLPYFYKIGLDISHRFAEQFGAFHDTLPESIKVILTENLTRLQRAVQDVLPTVAGTLGVVTGLPGFLANLLVALIATFFLARDRSEINAFLISLFPREWQPKLRQVREEVWSNSLGFAKAQLVLILLTMIQTIIGLWVIGWEYAVITGLIVGIADILPVLGPAAVFVPMIGYSFFVGQTAMGIKLTILYILVAGVRQVLEAKVVGDHIGLHPLTILFSIWLGFQFFGALGFVVGPLIAIMLKAVLRSGLLPSIQDNPHK